MKPFSSVYRLITRKQHAGIMIGGSNNTFNLKRNATRAEVSYMLFRYIKLTINPATAQGWAQTFWFVIPIASIESSFLIDVFNDSLNCCAKTLISLATTAKPLPLSPAFAASIEAF